MEDEDTGINGDISDAKKHKKKKKHRTHSHSSTNVINTEEESDYGDFTEKVQLGTHHGPNNLKRIDYVLLYDDEKEDINVSSSQRKRVMMRNKFEQTLIEEDLIIEKEKIVDKIYVKIHSNFNRLCKHAEAIKLQMPLKGIMTEFDTDKREKGCWTKFVEKYLKTDDEVDFVSAPFERTKIHLYEGYEDPNTFFRPALRSFLTHNILINMDISEKNSKTEDDLMSKKGLPYLLMKDAYSDGFMLHDESKDGSLKDNHEPDIVINPHTTMPTIYTPKDKYKDSDTEDIPDTRQELNKGWPKVYKYQPVWKIRNYFGEKIAFYFAWTGMLITSLWIPTLLGIGIFLYGLYLSITHYGEKLDEAAVNASLYNTTTTPKPLSAQVNAWMEIIKESFDNEVTPYFALITCLWGTLFLEFWKRKNATLSYEWDVDLYETTEPDRPQFFGTKRRPDPITMEDSWYYPFYRQFMKYWTSATVLIIMVCMVFISVAGVTLYRVIMTVDYCPNMSTIECAFFTTVLSSVLNAVSILILGKLYDKIAYVLTDWENHRTQTGYDDALIIKLFAFQFANSYASLIYIAFIRSDVGSEGLFGIGAAYKDDCGQSNNCMSLLSFQVLVLMLAKPFPKFFKDIILPWLKKKWQNRRCCCCCKRNKIDIEPEGDSALSDKVSLYLQREQMKPELGDFTLGEYTEKVIQYGYLMLFAASLSLAPLIALLTNLIDKITDAKRLMWWYRRPVAFIAQDIGMWYGILEFVNICGVISNGFIIAFTSSWGKKYDLATQLWIVLIFEHLVFGTKFLLSWLIPDVPYRVKLAMRREKYQVAKILETGMFSRDMKVKEMALNQAQLSRSPVDLQRSDIDLDASTSSLRNRRHIKKKQQSLNPDGPDLVPSILGDGTSLTGSKKKKKRKKSKHNDTYDGYQGDSDITPRTDYHKLAPLEEQITYQNELTPHRHKHQSDSSSTSSDDEQDVVKH